MSKPTEVVLTIEGQEILLNEDNCWVCLFTEAPEQDHIYVYAPTTFVIFNNRAVFDQLMQLGYPMQVRRLPTPWDNDAYDKYIGILTEELEHDIEEMEGHEPGS